MSTAEKLIARGKIEGIREGKIEGIREGEAKGKIEGIQKNIERIMNKRFQQIPSGFLKRLYETKELERLESILDQVLDVSRLDDIRWD